MSSNSFEEASESIRHLMEVAGGSCDAYAPPSTPEQPKKSFPSWEKVSSKLLHTEPEPVATHALPDWVEGQNFSPAGKNDEPSRDELDEFIRENLGFEKPEVVDPGVHQCCGCSCGVCEHGHGTGTKGQHTKACLTRFENEMSQPTPTTTLAPEKEVEVECGGMVQVYRGETAHPPITNEYMLIGSVDDGGELLAIYTAFQEAKLSGAEETEVKLDGGTHTLYNKKGRMELIDDVKGIRYIKADMAEMNHYAPIVEDQDTFIWVVPTPEHLQGEGDDLGYIHDGWAFGRLGRE